MSASWKPSVPISSVRTWPVTKTVGTESMHRVGDRRDQVGRPGPGGGEGDADPPGRLGVALGGVAAALLVADLDVVEVGVDEGVVGRQVGPAGDAEDVLDTLGLEDLHQCVGGSHGTGDGSSGSVPAEQGFWPPAAAGRAGETQRPRPPRGFQRVCGSIASSITRSLVALDGVEHRFHQLLAEAGSARGRGRAASCGSAL